MPAGVRIVVRADTAGCSYTFLDLLRQAGVGFSVGFPVDAQIRAAIREVPDETWVPARRQDGTLRNTDGDDRAAVAELTDSPHVDLTGYPPGTRLLVRREPFASRRAAGPGGHRRLPVHVFPTDQPDAELATLDVGHRGHACVEDRIRGAKNTGARSLPCESFDRNALWLRLQPWAPKTS